MVIMLATLSYRIHITCAGARGTVYSICNTYWNVHEYEPKVGNVDATLNRNEHQIAIFIQNVLSVTII